MPIRDSKYIFLAILLIILPTIIGLQPFFPKPIQIFLIYGRLIIIPVLIMISIPKYFNFYMLYIFLLYILILTYVNPPINLNDYFLSVTTLLASITFFKLGDYIQTRNSDNSKFIYLLYGVNIFNLITIIIFFLLSTGLIDVNYFFEATDKKIIELFRFSIGNPIELPFTITSLLYSSIILLDRKKNLLFSTSLNLTTAIISQSRIVVIIAFLLFVNELFRSSFRVKFFALAIITLVFLVFFDFWGEVILSFINRISGNDMGSSEDRRFIADQIFKNLNVGKLVFGDGITSSSNLLKSLTGTYRSVESVSLQLLNDIGLIGIFIFILNIFLRNHSIQTLSYFSFTIVFVCIQAFFFLPLFTLLPVIFFLLGVTMKFKANRDVQNSIEPA